MSATVAWSAGDVHAAPASVKASDEDRSRWLARLLFARTAITWSIGGKNGRPLGKARFSSSAARRAPNESQGLAYPLARPLEAVLDHLGLPADAGG
jgi:hypothetical protein